MCDVESRLELIVEIRHDNICKSELASARAASTNTISIKVIHEGTIKGQSTQWGH